MSKHKVNDYQYVFIIGAARSGTKFLRDVLAETPSVAAVPYDINYIWRYGNEESPTDYLQATALNSEIASHIKKYVLKYALSNYRHGSESEIEVILEKTVSNSLRLNYCAEVFPNAKFVILLRNGLDVTSSSMREWRRDVDLAYGLKKIRYIPFSHLRYLFKNFGLLKRIFGSSKRVGYQFWGPLTKDIDLEVTDENLHKVCARQWVECVETSLNDSRILDEDTVHIMRYEDFVSSVNTRKKLFNFVGVQDVEYVEHIFQEKFIKQNKQWDIGLSELQKKEVLEIVRSLLAKHGYMGQDC